jgi:hypothetical protein
MVGIRACSNILAIMADRWESAKDLRDVFELLATEIPIVENVPSTSQHCMSERGIKRVGNDTVLEIRSKLPHVRSVVINREILRMIEEMITEDLPSVKDSSVGILLDIGNKDYPMDSNNPASTTPLQNSPFTPYQFTHPNLWVDNFVGPIGDISPGPVLEFPGSLSGFDVF